MTTFKNRTELNSKSSEYTGNIVCFFGKSQYKDMNINAYCKVSDCNVTATLHMNIYGDNEKEFKDYKNKIKKLKDSLCNYIEFLETVRI